MKIKMLRWLGVIGWSMFCLVGIVAAAYSVVVISPIYVVVLAINGSGLGMGILVAYEMRRDGDL